MDQPRPSLMRALEDPLLHGGRLQEARRLFARATEPFIDLSTGINPLPYPIPQLGSAVWTRLPEPEEVAALEAVAAEAYGAPDPAMVAAAPGTQMLISLLPRLFPQSSVAILSPSYGEYARAFAAVGTRVVEVKELEQLEDAGPGGIVICNPNNPDGRRFDATTLIELLSARKAGGLVLVDEAFADLEDGQLGLAPHLPVPGLVVLRSLSKAYGLAGLRLGFAIAAPELAASIRAPLGPWPISGPAIDIGLRALSDRTWLAAAKRRLAGDVTRLDSMLRKAGLALIGGTLLFRLVETAAAPRLFHRLGAAGILVRRFDTRPDWLRFGIPGSEAAWQRLAGPLLEPS
ncbi:MAG: threonine-phosphate decarboxylase CobD [Methyloceanibacter sp.]